MKFKRIYIHIGMGKTGSSYLQSCFEQLELSGAFENTTYPVITAGGDFQTIRSGNALNLAMSLSIADSKAFSKTRMEAEIKQLLNSASSEKDQLLLSCEHFFSVDKALLAELLCTLKQYSSNISLIVVARSITELAYSSYNQYIKRHAAAHRYDDEFLNKFCLAIAETLKDLDSITQDVHVLPYKKNGLLDDFLYLLTEPVEIGAHFKNLTVNRSLDSIEIELLTRINEIFADEQLASNISDRWIYESAPYLEKDTKNDSRAIDIFTSYAEQMKPISPHTKKIIGLLTTSSENKRASPELENKQTEILQQKFFIALEEIVKYSSQLMFLKSYTSTLSLSKEHFDPIHYLLINQDVLRERMDPEEHYKMFGAYEDRYTCFI